MRQDRTLDQSANGEVLHLLEDSDGLKDNEKFQEIVTEINRVFFVALVKT